MGDRASFVVSASVPERFVFAVEIVSTLATGRNASLENAKRSQVDDLEINSRSRATVFSSVVSATFECSGVTPNAFCNRATSRREFRGRLTCAGYSSLRSATTRSTARSVDVGGAAQGPVAGFSSIWNLAALAGSAPDAKNLLSAPGIFV